MGEVNMEHFKAFDADGHVLEKEEVLEEEVFEEELRLNLFHLI